MMDVIAVQKLRMDRLSVLCERVSSIDLRIVRVTYPMFQRRKQQTAPFYQKLHLKYETIRRISLVLSMLSVSGV